MKCVSNIGDVVDDEECNMKLRPNDIENCDMGPCAKSWFLTEWGERVSMAAAHWVLEPGPGSTCYRAPQHHQDKSPAGNY